MYKGGAEIPLLTECLVQAIKSALCEYNKASQVTSRCKLQQVQTINTRHLNTCTRQQQQQQKKAQCYDNLGMNIYIGECLPAVSASRTTGQRTTKVDWKFGFLLSNAGIHTL